MVHPQVCAVAALHRQVTYLQRHGATNTTHLAAVRHKDKRVKTRSTKITAAIRAFVRAVGPGIGFTPGYLRACYLQAGGLMKLPMERVDPDTIRLVGRWWSDTMLR